MLAVTPKMMPPKNCCPSCSNFVPRPASAPTAEQLLAVLLEVGLILKLRADLGAGRAVVMHPLVVFQLQPLVAAVHLLPVFLGHLALMRHAVDHEVVDAEHGRHLLHHVGVEPRDGRADDDDRRHAYDDAYQRQKRPKLVREYGLQGDARGVGVEGVDRPHKNSSDY